MTKRGEATMSCLPMISLISFDGTEENQYFESLIKSSPYFHAVLTNNGDGQALTKLFSELTPEMRRQNANLTSPTGDSLLMLAVQKRNFAIVKLLLDQGANVQAQNVQGYTALHLAMMFHSTEIAELLLGYQADLCAKTKDGKAPFNLVTSRYYFVGQGKFLEFIKKHIGKIPSQEHESALKSFTHDYSYFCRDSIFMEIVQYLLRQGARGFDNEKSLLFAIINPTYGFDKASVERDVVLLKKLSGQWPHLLIGNGQKCLLEFIIDDCMKYSTRQPIYDFLKSCYRTLIENPSNNLNISISESLIQSYYNCLEAEEAFKSKQKMEEFAAEKESFSQLAQIAANHPGVNQYQHFLPSKYDDSFIHAFKKNRTVTKLIIAENLKLLCEILPANQALQAISFTINHKKVDEDDSQYQGLIDTFIKKLHDCPNLNTLKICLATDDIMCKILEVPNIHSVDLICEGGGGCLEYSPKLKEQLKNAKYLRALRFDVSGSHLLPECLEVLAQNSSLKQLHIDSSDEGSGARLGPSKIMNPAAHHLCSLIQKQQLTDLILTYDVDFHDEYNEINDGNEEHAWLFKFSLFKEICQSLSSCKSIVRLGFSTATFFKAHFEALLNLTNRNPYITDIDWYPSDIDLTRNHGVVYTTYDTNKFVTQCKPEYRNILIQIQKQLERNRALKGLIACVSKATEQYASQQSKLINIQRAIAEASTLYRQGLKDSMNLLKQICEDFGVDKLLLQDHQTLMPVQTPITICFQIANQRAFITKAQTEEQELFVDLQKINQANEYDSHQANENDSHKRKRDESEEQSSNAGASQATPALNNQSSSSGDSQPSQWKKAKTT